MPVSLKTLYERIQSRVPGYRFGGVFVLLLLTYVYLASAPPTGRWVPVVSLALMGATLLACLLASRSGRIAFYAAVIVLAAGFAAAILGLFGGYETEKAITYGVSALLVLAAPIAIANGVLQRGVVDRRTILAALSIYVLVGMLWAFTELTIQAATSHQFFVQTNKGSTADFLYFSFVTLTTVGYGDLTAAGGFARSLAVLEAMFGQMYLVTVVALLIANLRPARTLSEPQTSLDTE